MNRWKIFPFHIEKCPDGEFVKFKDVDTALKEQREFWMNINNEVIYKTNRNCAIWRRNAYFAFTLFIAVTIAYFSK